MGRPLTAGRPRWPGDRGGPAARPARGCVFLAPGVPAALVVRPWRSRRDPEAGRPARHTHGGPGRGGHEEVMIAVTTTGGLLQAGTFAHDALLYRSQDEYARQVCSFVRDGLAAAEPVLVAVPGRRLDLVRAALGEAAGAVAFADMT